MATLPTPADGREAYALNLAAATYRRMFKGKLDNLDGDDLWGAALLGAAQALARFDPGRGVQFRTWAIDCIRYAILEEMRAQMRERPETPPEPPASPDPIERLYWRRLLHRLPPRERAVIHAAYFEERTMAEVAQQWQRHPTRLRQLRRQAEDRLRRWARDYE